MGDAFTLFIRKVERDKSEAAVRSYTAAWKKMAYMERWPLRDLRTDAMQEVIDANADKSESTLNNIKIVFSAICAYGERNDILRRNCARFIETPKKEKVVKDAFSELELEKIRQAVDVVPFADVIYFMCITGCALGSL